jgi:hypothetical protein
MQNILNNPFILTVFMLNVIILSVVESILRHGSNIIKLSVSIRMLVIRKGACP